MTIKMKAAVLYEYGKPLVIEDVWLDPPKRGEVLIKMAASGICHSDVNVVNGDERAELPIILGHEAAGTVEQVGEGVVDIHPGERVGAGLWRSCGHCFYCSTGFPSNCETPHVLDTEIRAHNERDEPVRLGMRVASWAEYAVVDQSQIVRIPDDVPLETAALVGCGVITGVGAVINTAQVEAGSCVAVIGMGGVGVNAVQAARLAGARFIVGIDVLEEKLDVGRAFGATHVVNAAREDPLETIRGLTDSRGADYVFVTAGNPETMSKAFEMIRKRGTCVLIGLLPAGETAALPVTRVALTEGRIIGSYLGSSRLNVLVPQLLDLYRQDRLKLDELVTARYSLDQINEAIEVVDRGEAVRNVIVF